jgi:hypothetical protein
MKARIWKLIILKEWAEWRRGPKKRGMKYEPITSNVKTYMLKMRC